MKIFFSDMKKLRASRTNSPRRESWPQSRDADIQRSFRSLSRVNAAVYKSAVIRPDASGLTSWFWYAVTAVKMASLKTNVLCSSFWRSVMCKLLSSVCLQRTKCILGWYLCIEFSTICNNEKICRSIIASPDEIKREKLKSRGLLLMNSVSGIARCIAISP